MYETALLILAAILEVGGDALIRHGLKGGGILSMIIGVAVLAAYGFMVNLTKLDFGRLMGVYVVLFFVTSQIISVVFFKERLQLPVIVGGGLIAAGGMTMAVWR